VGQDERVDIHPANPKGSQTAVVESLHHGNLAGGAIDVLSRWVADGDHVVRHARSVVLSVCDGILVGEMARHTTFKLCLDPTAEQHDVLARHAGAARFAFNQCIRLVKTALTLAKTDSATKVTSTVPKSIRSPS
jgi:hypothetical protein